jgi:hypothetical protein
MQSSCERIKISVLICLSVELMLLDTIFVDLTYIYECLLGFFRNKKVGHKDLKCPLVTFVLTTWGGV